MEKNAIIKAADAINQARTLIITAGAGMGTDSGLPDFRSDRGFWNAYPPYEKLGIRFTDIATPAQFVDDPLLAWGFYGHRANMYRETQPHNGFQILRKWKELLQLQVFVVTSNVDGQFQKAGFDSEQIAEIHGSIHYLQCLEPCTPEIWTNRETFDISGATMRATSIPTCKHCGESARPNILMFNDWSFIPGRSNAQQRDFQKFVARCTGPIAVIEIGAGRAIPTIRWTSENLGRELGATVIRINPIESEIAAPHLSVPARGAETLQRIDEILSLN